MLVHHPTLGIKGVGEEVVAIGLVVVEVEVVEDGLVAVGMLILLVPRGRPIRPIRIPVDSMRIIVEMDKLLIRRITILHLLLVLVAVVRSIQILMKRVRIHGGDI
jgi:hypothetical protein